MPSLDVDTAGAEDEGQESILGVCKSESLNKGTTQINVHHNMNSSSERDKVYIDDHIKTADSELYSNCLKHIDKDKELSSLDCACEKTHESRKTKLD